MNADYPQTYAALEFAATQAPCALDRAVIAADLLQATPIGTDLCRAFDDCFEMGDGDTVKAILILAAREYQPLAEALRQRGFSDWLETSELCPS